MVSFSWGLLVEEVAADFFMAICLAFFSVFFFRKAALFAGVKPLSFFYTMSVSLRIPNHTDLKNHQEIVKGRTYTDLANAHVEEV